MEIKELMLLLHNPADGIVEVFESGVWLEFNDGWVDRGAHPLPSDLGSIPVVEKKGNQGNDVNFEEWMP